MKRQRAKLLAVAALAVLTNGLALLGLGHGSAGAVARTIECTHTLNRSLTIDDALRRQPGEPPRPRGLLVVAPYFA